MLQLYELFPWSHGVFHISPRPFFCKKHGLIWKLVCWPVPFSTLLSDKPKYWNILAKCRQLFLTVAWSVSVLRWRRWENVQTGQTSDSFCWRCWEAHPGNYKGYEIWAPSLIQNDVGGLTKPRSSQSLFFHLLHFLTCFYFI